MRFKKTPAGANSESLFFFNSGTGTKGKEEVMQISYARVSTQDQNLDLQAAASQESKPIALSPGVHDIRLDYS